MSIGGYFDLTEQDIDSWKTSLRMDTLHKPNHLIFSTGSNSLIFLLSKLSTRNKSKIVYLPNFYCETVIKNLIDFGFIPISYEVDNNFNPINIEDLNLINSLAFVLVDYFGICDYKNNTFLPILRSLGLNIILDEAGKADILSLDKYEPEIYGVFNSLRKFTKCLDGSEIYCREEILVDNNFNQSNIRIEISDRITLHKNRSKNYEDDNLFRKLDQHEFYKTKNLNFQSVSDLSYWIYLNTDFKQIVNRRFLNFNIMKNLFFESGLIDKKIVLPEIQLCNGAAPLYFPIFALDDVTKLRKFLYSNGVVAPKHWPRISGIENVGWVRTSIFNNFLSLPIDQRLGPYDLNKIVNLIASFFSNNL